MTGITWSYDFHQSLIRQYIHQWCVLCSFIAELSSFVALVCILLSIIMPSPPFFSIMPAIILLHIELSLPVSIAMLFIISLFDIIWCMAELFCIMCFIILSIMP